jgi:hypothetical protein
VRHHFDVGLETIPYDMTLIATATASDGIDEIWYLIAWAGLILSYVLGIVTLTVSMISRGSRALAIWLAVIGAAVSLFPILFVLHIYRIDFVAVGGDGTSASPPIISVMIWPLLPLFICLVAGGIAYTHRRSPNTTL